MTTSTFKYGQAEWDEEQGNALLARPSQTLANNIGISAGDYFECTAEASANTPSAIVGESCVFQANEVHNLSFDSGDNTVRTAQVGRHRFTQFDENVTDSDVETITVNATPLENKPGREYYGIAQKRTEWDYSRTDERIVIDQRIPFDSKYATVSDSNTGSDRFENARTESGWDNVRIYNADLPESEYAAYTIYAETDIAQNRRPRIYMGGLGRDKITLNRPNSLVARVQRPVADTRVTEPRRSRNDTSKYYSGEVENNSEFASWYGNVESSNILIFAPHGGFETRSNRIAREAARQAQCAYWIQEGAKDGGGSFDRWHITSVDMSNGFSAIEELGGDWDYVFSIHGYGESDRLIGGQADIEFRKDISQVISNANGFDSTDVSVYGYNSGPEHEPYAGKRDLNITNRLTASNGKAVQIEYPYTRSRNSDSWVEEAKYLAIFINNYIRDP